eukprot:5764834-Pyramimonas_sp.AAC.1
MSSAAAAANTEPQQSLKRRLVGAEAPADIAKPRQKWAGMVSRMFLSAIDIWSGIAPALAPGRLHP